MARNRSPPSTPVQEEPPGQGETEHGSDEEETDEKPMSAVKPTMGGLVKQSDGLNVTWTGGEPNRSWTSLVEPNPVTINPTQFRSTRIGTQTKSKCCRTLSTTAKLIRDGDLLTFQKKVLDHLEEHGMDLITFVPSPSGGNNMVSVVTDHGRFSPKQATDLKEDQKKKCDSCDHANMRDAKKFLLASIDPTQHRPHL